MTIALLQSGIRINGVEQLIGSRWNLSEADEQQLVGRGVAQYVDIYEGAPAGPDSLSIAGLPGFIARADLLATGLPLEPYLFNTADGQIIPGECWVHGFRVLAGTSPTLDLHAGTSTSDETIYGGGGPLTVGQYYQIVGTNNVLAHCRKGLYGNLGGTTPAFVVWAVVP